MNRTHPGTDLSETLEAIRTLVEEVAQAVSTDPPRPLFEYGQTSRTEGTWYLVGIVGGKEVGKSALVNSLAGCPVSDSTSFGPGTEKVVAFVHDRQADSVSRFLQAEVGNRFEIVPHRSEKLDRQVLLDLPDIDSHYSSHFETVRNLLRFILYPIWVQSVEKYADRQPMELLRQVVKGNAPENFLYCLNKVDQIERQEGPAAITELAEDYGKRLASSLGLAGPPRVYRVSAIHPDRYDLPLLREAVSAQKREEEVAASRSLALRRLGNSLLDWVSDRRLTEQVERLEKVENHLTRLLRNQVETVLVNDILPAIRSDDRVRRWLLAETFQARVRLWPIIGSIDSVTSPITRWLPKGASPGAETTGNLSRRVVEEAFDRCTPPLHGALQTCFAKTRNADPAIARIYENHPFWEEKVSKASTGFLKQSLRRTHESLLENTRKHLLPPGGTWSKGWRWGVVTGAILWFPFGQPLLQHYLETGSFEGFPLAIVRLFGVPSLLSSTAFLLLLFGFTWLGIRRRAQRSAEKAWEKAIEEGENGESGLTGTAREWGLHLLEPLENEKGRFERLEKRRKELEERLQATEVE